MSNFLLNEYEWMNEWMNEWQMLYFRQVQRRAGSLPESQVRDIFLGQQGDIGDQRHRSEWHGKIQMRGVKQAGPHRVNWHAPRLQ